MSDYDAFAPVYDAVRGRMTEDVAFYVALAAEADGPVVELAVGNGRVAIPIAERTGRRVIGIDALGGDARGRARERAAGAGVELDLRQGDMRELALEEPTDLVICPFRAMLHLPTTTSASVSCGACAAALVPAAASPGTPSSSIRRSPTEIGGVWREESGVRNRSTYDFAERRIDLELESGATRAALVGRARRVGGGDRRGRARGRGALRAGSTARPFDETSREFVYVARRPA